MKKTLSTYVTQSVVSLPRIWIMDDQATEQKKLHAFVTRSMKSLGWECSVDLTESGAALIEKLSTKKDLGACDFIIADGQVGDDPGGGAALIRSWLDVKFGSHAVEARPHLMMISGQPIQRIQPSFDTYCPYPAIMLSKPKSETDSAFQEILAKFFTKRIAPVINSFGAVVGIFDAAPNTFRKSLIVALGASNDRSVVLVSDDPNDFAKGPLKWLTDTLEETFGDAFGGHVSKSDVETLAKSAHQIRVGLAHTWLSPFISHHHKVKHDALNESSLVLVDRVAMCVRPTWEELDTLVTQYSDHLDASADAAIQLEHLLPRNTWIVRRGNNTIEYKTGETFSYSNRNEKHRFAVVLLRAARTCLCTSLANGDTPGDHILIPFVTLDAAGNDLYGKAATKKMSVKPGHRLPYHNILIRAKSELSEGVAKRDFFSYLINATYQENEGIRLPKDAAFCQVL